MAKKLLKWTFRVIGCVLLLLLLFYTYIHFVMGRRINKKYDVSPSSFVIPSDSTTIEKGRHLVAIKGCNECHAHRLLTDQKLTVEEVAYELGYEHAQHFSASFKSYFGQSPSLFARRR